jgi:DNA invertase Pin-like site-specific DNA recombinase
LLRSEREIGFRSLTENIDTTSSGGRLIFHVFGALAEFERCIIRERTTAGLTAARARGRLGGRPRSLDEADIHIARALLKDGKLTFAEIADRLDVASSTLYKHLPRPRSTITLGEPV